MESSHRCLLHSSQRDTSQLNTAQYLNSHFHRHDAMDSYHLCLLFPCRLCIFQSNISMYPYDYRYKPNARQSFHHCLLLRCRCHLFLLSIEQYDCHRYNVAQSFHCCQLFSYQHHMFLSNTEQRRNDKTCRPRTKQSSHPLILLPCRLDIFVLNIVRYSYDLANWRNATQSTH